MTRQAMRVRDYCAHPSICDQRELLKSRSGGQSEVRPSVFKSPSKLSTHLSTRCSRDERLRRLRSNFPNLNNFLHLSLASIDLNYDLSWSTNTDNFGSDHFPIIINYKRANRNRKKPDQFQSSMVDSSMRAFKSQKRKLLNKARKNFKEEDWIKYKAWYELNKTIGEMQESLNKISVWCKKWKLSTSPEKSSLLNFSRKRSTIPPLLKICDKPIPEVKSLKILGIIFDPNTTWKNHINYLRQKGFKYLNAIKALSSPKIGTRSDHLLNIINATIRSIFDYGSQLFSFSSNSNRQKLEPIYNAALRLALGLPRNTPLDLLRAESMNGNINSRHNFLCQKFITKQIALKDWSPNARLFWNIDSNFYKYREKRDQYFSKDDQPSPRIMHL
ncbi:putative RNA-directed DNA polymerase from transposon BS [Trichonephila clavipes]|nr:putative RNA-directed DNA polymerase from transposon BS [Trichonephila clavipes]